MARDGAEPNDLAAALAARYRLEGELGRGGMATVYRAHDLRHDRSVAIKVLRPELVAGLNGDRFTREIRLAARLTHPHIVGLLDSGEAAGVPYYVMTYVEGESLRQRLEREGRFSLETALAIVRDVAEALAFAHEQGVVHRDVKPENILLAHGHALIADFGIAQALQAAGAERLTATGLIVGTPAYMSPEQTGGGEAVDGRADLYSLACVLYEMLGGQPPFTGPTAMAVLVRQANERALPLASLRPGTPAAVSHALERALAKEPAERFPSVTAFVTALGHPTEAGRERSIVVTPFANLSPDPDNEYFADGLTEDVIMDLSKIRALTVISRTSSMLLKGTRRDTRAIGRELNVRYVLEGTVRRAGQSVRVTAQLIDAERDAHLWAERYSGTVEDVFEMQERLAKRIAEALQVVLSQEEETALADRPLVDARALDCYHRARQEMLRFTAEGIERAQRQLEAGIALVGENAFLRAAQANVCLWAIGGVVTVSAVLIEEAERYTRLAERLDPTSPDVLYVKAMIATQRGELEAAIHLLRESLRRRPKNPDVVLWLAWVYICLDQVDVAEPLIDAGFALDPLTPIWHSLRGFLRLIEGRPHEAAPHFAKWRQLDAENPPALLMVMITAILTDNAEQAHGAAEGLATMAPGSLPAKLGAFWSHGLRGDREGALAQITPDVIAAAEAPDVQITMLLAFGYFLAGDDELALKWLERSVPLGAPGSSFWRSLPFLGPLLGDPRFQELMVQKERRAAAFRAADGRSGTVG